MEEVTGTQVDSASEDAANFAKRNDAQMAENLSKVPAISRVANQIKGYVMEQRAQKATSDTVAPDAVRSEAQALMMGLPVVAVLVAWRWHRLRRGTREL